MGSLQNKMYSHCCQDNFIVHKILLNFWDVNPDMKLSSFHHVIGKKSWLFEKVLLNPPPFFLIDETRKISCFIYHFLKLIFIFGINFKCFYSAATHCYKFLHKYLCVIHVSCFGWQQIVADMILFVCRYKAFFNSAFIFTHIWLHMPTKVLNT